MSERVSESYLRGVDHLQAGDRAAVKTISDEENRSLERGIRREPVPPLLAVTVERADAVAVNVDILAAKLPHGGRDLEGVLEGAGQPVVNVVAKVDGAGEGDVDGVEEREVERVADGVRLVEDDGAAVVAAVEGLEDGGRVVAAVCTGFDGAGLCPRGGGGEGAARVEGGGLDVWAATGGGVGEGHQGGGEETAEQGWSDHGEQ